MLWALHNRATEAARTDGVLVDPDSIRIHDAIDYDFSGQFGDPAGSLAARAAGIDGLLRQWILCHPAGMVVSLGEGLETQARRVDDGRVRWLSVDLPDAIRLREHFIAPTERFRHVAVSALDHAWMDAVEPSNGVVFVAQGLLMYLEPNEVRRLLCAVADRFPGCELVFDVVPPWFSSLTLRGLNQTPRYCLPPMPWGISRDDLAETLRRWHPRLTGLSFLDYRAPRGLPLLLASLLDGIPGGRNAAPSLVHVVVAAAPDYPSTERGPPREHLPIPGKQAMISNDDGPPGTFCGVFAEAAESVGRGNDLALAASEIMVKRVALGLAAAINPLQADHVEFGRIVPEKVEAFSAAGWILLEQSGAAGQHIARLASAEVVTTARAAMEMAGCANPAALATAQVRFAVDWFNRAASNSIAVGMRALRAQDAAMAPIRRTVISNAERLGR
jgi:hypothetical protein